MVCAAMVVLSARATLRTLTSYFRAASGRGVPLPISLRIPDITSGVSFRWRAKYGGFLRLAPIALASALRPS